MSKRAVDTGTAFVERDYCGEPIRNEGRWQHCSCSSVVRWAGAALSVPGALSFVLRLRQDGPRAFRQRLLGNGRWLRAGRHGRLQGVRAVLHLDCAAASNFVWRTLTVLIQSTVINCFLHHESKSFCIRIRESKRADQSSGGVNLCTSAASN